MRLIFDPKFLKNLAKFKKNKKTYNQINQKLKIFQKSPQHPSLRLHKLSGRSENAFSISIDKSIRIICVLKKDFWQIVNIGTHDQVYKEN